MRIKAEISGLHRAARGIKADIDRSSNRAIEIGGEGLLQDLRDDTRRALGDRLARTWRLRLYRKDKAAFIWSKAPRIIDQNMRGGVIVPIAGSRYLALPTANVPRRRGGRGAKGRMSPEEVEAHYAQDLIIRRGNRAGQLLGFVDANKGPFGRRGKRQRLVLMFTFARSVFKPKTISPDQHFGRWRRRTRSLLEGDLR